MPTGSILAWCGCCKCLESQCKDGLSTDVACSSIPGVPEKPQMIPTCHQTTQMTQMDGTEAESSSMIAVPHLFFRLQLIELFKSLPINCTMFWLPCFFGSAATADWNSAANGMTALHLFCMHRAGRAYVWHLTFSLLKKMAWPHSENIIFDCHIILFDAGMRIPPSHIFSVGNSSTVCAKNLKLCYFS